MLKICKGLDEKDMTNKAYPLWIWCVIWNGFIPRTLRRDSSGSTAVFRLKRGVEPNEFSQGPGEDLSGGIPVFRSKVLNQAVLTLNVLNLLDAEPYGSLIAKCFMHNHEPRPSGNSALAFSLHSDIAFGTGFRYQTTDSARIVNHEGDQSRFRLKTV